MPTQKRNYKSVGIILSWNCAPWIKAIYDRLPKDSFDEIILADDGSTDDSMAVAEKLGITCFTHAHSGYGGNIKFGLQKAVELGADYMVEIHGDDQYDPSFIPRALEMMQGSLPAATTLGFSKTGYRQENLGGADFLLGSRFVDIRQPLRDKMPLERYLANIGLSFIDRLVLQVPLTEFHSGFRVYSKKLVETVDFTHTANSHRFSFQIIAQARFCNMRIKELPIRCDYKEVHTSISIRESIFYALSTFGTLFSYILAQLGVPRKLFRCKACAR